MIAALKARAQALYAGTPEPSIAERLQAEQYEWRELVWHLDVWLTTQAPLTWNTPSVMMSRLSIGDAVVPQATTQEHYLKRLEALALPASHNATADELADWVAAVELCSQWEARWVRLFDDRLRGASALLACCRIVFMTRPRRQELGF